jgi:hypothetical protein
VTGAVNRLMNPFEALVQGELGRELGGGANAGRLFAPPVEALETNALDIRRNATIPLVWRSGVCAQLRIRGSCPAHRNEVVISSSLSSSLALHHPWRIGQRLRMPGWGTLTITGIYTPPDISKDYWFGRGPSYFAHEHPAAGASLLAPHRRCSMPCSPRVPPWPPRRRPRRAPPSPTTASGPHACPRPTCRGCSTG